METTKLSSKGQVVLPKSVRDAQSLSLPGTEFAVEEVSEGILLRPLRPFASTRYRRGIRLPEVHRAGEDASPDGEGYCSRGESAA